MGYFNDDDYAFTHNELSCGLNHILTEDYDEEQNINESIDSRVINNKLIKIIGSSEGFEEIKEDIVKTLVKNRLQMELNSFTRKNEIFSNYDNIFDPKGIIVLIKFILIKKGIELNKKIEANINIIVNKIIKNKNFDIIYDRVGLVQSFIHEHASSNDMAEKNKLENHV